MLVHLTTLNHELRNCFRSDLVLWPGTSSSSTPSAIGFRKRLNIWSGVLCARQDASHYSGQRHLWTTMLCEGKLSDSSDLSKLTALFVMYWLMGPLADTIFLVATCRYTTKSEAPEHYVQYDQGEDRWLCTLLLQRGYRVEYSAASDAYTHCPTG